MKRILVDALLIAVTAALIWVIRGDAQNDPVPVPNGLEFQLQCTDGSISNADIFTGSLNRYDILWRTIDNLNPNMNGIMNATCNAIWVTQPDDTRDP